MSATVPVPIDVARAALFAAWEDFYNAHHRQLVADDPNRDTETLWTAASICTLAEVFQYLQAATEKIGTKITLDQITALALMTARGLATGPDGEKIQ